MPLSRSTLPAIVSGKPLKKKVISMNMDADVDLNGIAYSTCNKCLLPFSHRTFAIHLFIRMLVSVTNNIICIHEFIAAVVATMMNEREKKNVRRRR